MQLRQQDAEKQHHFSLISGRKVRFIFSEEGEIKDKYWLFLHADSKWDSWVINRPWYSGSEECWRWTLRLDWTSTLPLSYTFTHSSGPTHWLENWLKCTICSWMFDFLCDCRSVCVYLELTIHEKSFCETSSDCPSSKEQRPLQALFFTTLAVNKFFLFQFEMHLWL